MLDSYTFKQRELSNVALTGNRDTFLFVFVIFFKVLSYLYQNNVHVFMCYNYSKLFYLLKFIGEVTFI